MLRARRRYVRVLRKATQTLVKQALEEESQVVWTPTLSNQA